MERMLTEDGLIRRRQRVSLERFLRHANPHVGEYALQLIAADALERERRRVAQMLDDADLCATSLFFAEDEAE